MAMITLYPRLSIEELDNIFEKTLKDITKWFAENPKRKVCRVGWIYGEIIKIRKNYIKQDIYKAYQKTKLETFKSC